MFVLIWHFAIYQTHFPYFIYDVSYFLSSNLLLIKYKVNTTLQDSIFLYYNLFYCFRKNIFSKQKASFYCCRNLKYFFWYFSEKPTRMLWYMKILHAINVKRLFTSLTNKYDIIWNGEGWFIMLVFALSNLNAMETFLTEKLLTTIT